MVTTWYWNGSCDTILLMWNAIQVANLFKIARETVRQYSMEFGSYLSSEANPGKNRTRVYNSSDMEVFALIVAMKGQGKQYPDIHAALLNGDRAQLPNGTETTSLSNQPRYTQLQLKLDFLEKDAKEKELEIVRLAALLDRSDTQLSDARKEIRLLYEEIGRLKANITPP
jgi:DNA-binding transcriptional MerR regulator